MAKCLNCGNTFDLATTQEEYDEYVGDGDYDGDLCSDCAIPDYTSNLNAGRAIDMMNGEEEYDDEFVQEWL